MEKTVYETLKGHPDFYTKGDYRQHKLTKLELHKKWNINMCAADAVLYALWDCGYGDWDLKLLVEMTSYPHVYTYPHV